MASDPTGGNFIGLQLGRKLASLPQSGSIEPARRLAAEFRAAVPGDAVALPRPGVGVVSQSFAGDLAPVQAVHVMAQVGRELDAAVLTENRQAAVAAAQPVTKGKLMSNASTPKLNSLKGAFAGFTERVEAAADTVLKRMEAVGGGAETSVAKLNSAIDPVEAIVKQIDDAANQLTNGGPPLDASAKP